MPTVLGRFGPSANLIDPLNFGMAFTLDPMEANASMVIGTANRAVYARCLNGAVITKVRVNVIVSAGNISVAMYRNTGVGPSATMGTRIATSGSVVCPAAGVADIALGATVTVLPGDWLAVSVSDATAALAAQGTSALATTRAAGRMYYQDTAHPLPATPVPNAGIVGPILLMGVA